MYCNQHNGGSNQQTHKWTPPIRWSHGALHPTHGSKVLQQVDSKTRTRLESAGCLNDIKSALDTAIFQHRAQCHRHTNKPNGCLLPWGVDLESWMIGWKIINFKLWPSATLDELMACGNHKYHFDVYFVVCCLSWGTNIGPTYTLSSKMVVVFQLSSIFSWYVHFGKSLLVTGVLCEPFLQGANSIVNCAVSGSICVKLQGWQHNGQHERKQWRG